MNIKIALAGNPNAGKTTLFNILTGSNQFVGNWPGVTVEKKEGKLKAHNDVIVTDLPGIYSLSPYSPEEVVARKYLLNERPDVILNIIDGTNLERNLYLTTQLLELGIPVVCAVNMMDVVRKSGDKLDTKRLSGELGCEVVEISALKSIGIKEAAQKAIEAAKEKAPTKPRHIFCGSVERAIARIEEALHSVPEEQRRFYAVKIFERDEKALEQLKLPDDVKNRIENDVAACEKEMDDDAESVITNERYIYIGKIIKDCLKRKGDKKLTASDKIDRIVTNRWLGLPIFAVIMFLVYYISMVTVGTAATDWANDGVFGDGWHLLGIGDEDYSAAAEEYGDTDAVIEGFLTFAEGKEADISVALKAFGAESESLDVETVEAELNALSEKFLADTEFTYQLTDEETLKITTETATVSDLKASAALLAKFGGAPDPSGYGVWVPSIPSLIEQGLDAVNCEDWLKGFILDGIVAGVGAVLGFIPQLLILFIFLAFLEACGYMARIAFVLDRVFRKFGLSGKSFIPILIGTGCGVPAIMASRTIENERDRRMTIMTTTFIPCGAKMPFIAMMAGAIFGGSPWISTGAYFIGILAIIVSGIMLKKTKMFSGEAAPFVMELPSYHLPTIRSVLRSMWERGWSFIKKAGTIILLSTIVIWFTSYFGWVDGTFTMLSESQMEYSILAAIGNTVCALFAPLGWGNWQATIATVTGLVAKENIVGTFGVLYGGGEASVYSAMAAEFTAVSGMSFLIFNLLCTPCFAAIGAIRREMNSKKWFLFAICYEVCFAYAVSLIVNSLGNLFVGKVDGTLGIICTAVSITLILALIYMLVKPYRKKIKEKI